MTISEPVNDTPAGQMPEVWGRIPPRNKNFTGRDDLLSELREGINKVTAVVPQALHGLGGVGKTQLAIEYAWRHRGDYDLVWWIPSDQQLLIPSTLAALAPHLGLPGAATSGIQETAEAVLNALQRGVPYRRWLLIFDNAEQPKDVKDLIPQGGTGHVLITSRNPQWEEIVKTLRVDVFSRAESISFLNKRVRRSITKDDAERLADSLGDLPLALEQAGAMQTQTGMTTEDYLLALSEQTRTLLNQNKPMEYPLSMTAAWRLSVTELEARLPEAIELLRCCAFFGPEPIPLDVFRRGNKVDIPRLSKVLSDPIDLSRAVRELGRFALARIEPEARTLQVHRLVQALLRDDLPKEKHETLRHEVHLLLANSAPKDPDELVQQNRFAELIGHVAPSRLSECTDAATRALALNIVRYLYRVGNYRSAESFANDFLDRWTVASGPDHRDVLTLRRHLGTVLWQLGDYTASTEINHATLERMRQTLGADDPETLRVTNSYGANLRADGDFRGALQLDRESREAYERVLGATDPSTLRVVHNLALDHALISDYPTAEKLHKLAYLEQRGQETASRWDVLSSWNGMARAVRLRGFYMEAVDLGEEAYAYGVSEFSVADPLTLLTANDLSIARRRLGELPEALNLAQETFGRFERALGGDNPGTLAAAVNLANALRQAGSHEEAFALLRETVPRYARVYGENHPYTRGCNTNLALLLRLSGDAESARALDEASRESLADSVGLDHDYTLTCSLNLAGDLAALGETRAAVELGEDTWRRLSDAPSFGADHPLTLAAAANLSLDRRADGDETGADDLREATLRRYEASSTPDRPDARLAEAGERIDCDFDPPPI